MKKTILLALLAVCAMSAGAVTKDNKKENPNKPVFTVVKENPITSIKDQNRSGTCWDYSTLSFFENEILKATGKTYDLCESFVANKTYMDRAIQVVRSALRHLPRERNALPGQPLRRLAEQLQRILQGAHALRSGHREKQFQEAYTGLEERIAGYS